MKILKKINIDPYIDPYITPVARILAACLIAASSYYFWTFGFSTGSQDQSPTAMFGIFPLGYGLCIAVASVFFGGDKRNHVLKKMVGIPILFASASLIGALIIPRPGG